MTEIVGYKLVDAEGATVKTWGGVWGRCPGVPNPIVLPNGDAVHAPTLGTAYQGYTLMPWEMDAPAPTGAQVDAERERRIALPLEVTLSVGTITINMDAHAQRNIQGLASVGQYLVATSSSDTTAFRDYDNTSHDLAPADLIGMGLQVAQRIQSVYAASWAIKAMDPIPADYADDGWWA